MSLLSQWNTIKSSLNTATIKCSEIHGGEDKIEIDNTTSDNNVDTTSEEYLKSLFEYANQWNCTKRPLYSTGRTTPTRTHINWHCTNANTRRSHDTAADWGWGDNYIGVRECYVYCSQDYTLSTSFFTDDEGSLWLNGNQVATTASCKTTSVSMAFKKGLNHVEIAFAEASGGDAGYITTNLANQSWVKWMYARYKL